MSLIGCDIEFLKEYISSMFSEGMSWDNYGEWHLDHVVLLIYLILTNRKNVLIIKIYSLYGLLII